MSEVVLSCYRWRSLTGACREGTMIVYVVGTLDVVT
jgi:hypothetical protein